VLTTDRRACGNVACAARRAGRRAPGCVLLAAGFLLAASAAVGAQSHLASAGTALIAAVRAADAAAVRALLADAADADARQPDGATALHWAMHRESMEVADLLIRAGADVDATNDLGVTPLLMACARGHGALVERLLAAGADPAGALPSGETALMAAARAGSLEAVNALLDAGAPVNPAESTRGQSALMWAVANRHPAITRALLDHGADIHARTDTRRRVYNMGGSRSAGSASRGIALEEVTLGGSTPLLFAARSGDLESARLLIAAGADVHDTAADGNTVLNIAVHSGHGSLAAFLLDAGADPNAAPLGYTALHAAVLRGTLRDRGVVNDDPGAGVPLVRALLDAGAAPDARLLKGTPVRRWSHDFAFMDRWVGATPFWLAARFLEIEMMRVLAAAGADPRLPSRDGTTPLMAAAGQGYNRGGGSAFIRDRRDFSSYNPVESAALGSTIPAAEERLARAAVAAALDLGADSNTANEAGDTALHVAASHGMNSVIELLASRGADLRAENRRGETPLALAVYADGIGGDRFVREDTAALLRTLSGSGEPADAETPAAVAESAHAVRPHEHPEAQALTNPVAATPDSVAAGAGLYATHCATCHGPTGRGDGRLAAATAAYGARPSNLADTTWQHGGSDGEIFIAIRDGIGPDFAMDAFGGRLAEPDIWRLVNYLQSLR
jgi:ankyrin repeat protein